jgi:hypothetical protein
MPTIINIYTLKINSISSNASVNIGETFHSSHSANLKSTGSNTSYGDEAPPISTMKNIYVDPDVNDQNQSKTTVKDTLQQ